MATNRDIVATRKLNKENKARLGRGGDTKIRKVAGRNSHVNALEAYLIDVDRKAGEEYTKRVGSGTTNPLTGMPEYQDPGRLSYEELQGLSGTDYKEYLAQWGISTEQAAAIEDPRGAGKAELGFAAEQQALTLSGAETAKSLTERGLGTTKRFTEKGLLASKEAAAREAGIATAGITAGVAGTREALGRQLSAGSRGIGRGMAQARAGAESAAAQSGFARSGTVTGAMGQQMKALTQDYGQLQADYAGGLGAATRQADIGSARVRAGEQTAAESYKLGMAVAGEDYTQGMNVAAADYKATTGAADLAYRQQTYGIGKAEMDKFYGAMGEFGGDQRAYMLEGEGGEQIRMITSGGQKRIMVGGAWVDATDEEYDAAYAG